jgi:predicted metal-dependent hydrolase
MEERLPQSRMGNMLFKYRVRVSTRARWTRLRVSPQDGLEVIVPKGFDTAEVPALLERENYWIRAALGRAESSRKFSEPKSDWQVPIQIELPAAGVVWQVNAKDTDMPWVAIREVDAGCLLIVGSINDEKVCRAALARWLIRQAKRHLLARLEAISIKTSLPFERALVKRQKTRWASCSTRKAISLNAKLLFLAPELVDYVLIHELCHIAFMNHSKQFWELVEFHCPYFRELDSQVRNMWKRMPGWA